MTKQEKSRLKREQRDEATRKARIAEIQAGNVQAPAEYNDPLAGRRAALKAAPESSYRVATLKKYQDYVADLKKDK